MVSEIEMKDDYLVIKNWSQREIWGSEEVVWRRIRGSLGELC